ncbi:MAG: GNAT family N-acetyltransferase [Anaerolineales bacterium]
MMDNPIPTIKTSRLTLRPFHMDDVTALHLILNEPSILKYFPTTSPPSIEKVEKTIDHQLTHWQTYGLGWWALTLLEKDELIGWCGLYFIAETNETEVGYLLSKAHWGKGYATESAKASLDFGFQVLNKKEIIGLTHPENHASQHVLLKCGLTFTRKAEYFGMDMFRYSMFQESNP